MCRGYRRFAISDQHPCRSVGVLFLWDYRRKLQVARLHVEQTLFMDPRRKSEHSSILRRIDSFFLNSFFMVIFCSKVDVIHTSILAIQDTSYFIYTNHPKTKGLGEISMKKGKHREAIYSRELVMHTCFAITMQGTPLGLLV